MSQFTPRRYIKVLVLGGLVLSGIVVFMQVGGSTYAKPQPAQTTEGGLDVFQCTEPRPQICTQEYVPVCASLKDGTKQTYPSECAACSDANVVSYLLDQCE